MGYMAMISMPRAGRSLFVLIRADWPHCLKNSVFIRFSYSTVLSGVYVCPLRQVRALAFPFGSPGIIKLNM